MARLSWICCSLLLAGCAGAGARTTQPPALGQDAVVVEDDGMQAQDEAEPGHGFVHGALWYIPNRIFDLLDIVRARVRVGPGLEVDLRATELADLNLGGYATVFVGIPGPRRERAINWPFGFEAMAGAEVSVIDLTAESGGPPHYGVLEVGLGAQLAIIGFDLGVDPFEALDFVTGIVTIDPAEDDL